MGVCLGSLTGCDGTKAPVETPGAVSAPPAFPGSLIEGMPPLNKELPPETAKEITALLEKEQSWLTSPPKDRTPAQLDKDFADLRWEVARKFGMHDVEGAISYARASLSLDEAHPQRWELLGDWYSIAGDPASLRAAANAYDNATFLNPPALGPHRKLAAAHMMLKQHREAMRQFEYCLGLADEKEERELVPLYAAACAAAGEFKRGIVFCQKVAEGNPNPQFRLAWAIFEKAAGNHDAAVKLLAEIEKAEPKDSPFAECAVTLRMRYEKEKGGVK
jgi:tetratricopeptide (TPR) repeat protein